MVGALSIFFDKKRIISRVLCVTLRPLNKNTTVIFMKKHYFLLGLAALSCMTVAAQSVTIKGIGHNNRYDDGDQMKSTWIGSLYDENGNYTGKTAFIVDQGIYEMTLDGNTLSDPVKNPAVNLSDIKQGSQIDYEKALWATNFNLMYGNSGAAYVGGTLITVMSRDESSTTDDELFAVRTWDAETGDKLTDAIYPKSATLESAGMSVNPKDGKVYGLFYLTGQQLASYITDDPEYFEDEDSDLTDGDAGYAICTIDTETMTVTPITPGLYYFNFITFAINSEGRAFALTSGGTSGAVMTNGKVTDMDGNLSGAQLYEFDLSSGKIIMQGVPAVDEETGEEYTEYVTPVKGTGYCSQYRRQAACFANSDPNTMYWVGYINSGKGINDWGSWSSLSDKEWRTNGKYDTALYKVDITTGEATQVQKIKNRWIFSALWIDGDDPSDHLDISTGITNTANQTNTGMEVYNTKGQYIGNTMPQKQGLYIVRQNGTAKKQMVR